MKIKFDNTKLKKFAQFARRSLIEQVSAKLKMVLAESSAARRESADVIKSLDEAISQNGRKQVVERVAYIWFNRFCALRFMDVNRYTRIGVVSPAEGQFQPEILAEAKMGHIDEEMIGDKIRQQIFALLNGKATSSDPQGEAYRLLVVGSCNNWHQAMPFLFQRIDDYTGLLMPDDLLSGNSILAYTREAMTPDTCRNLETRVPIVEVIGWLYQFYISEKKDEVFAGMKTSKIIPENIPAATQLFTPHYIVRYLVENSLGRLWMLNRPSSKLIDRMSCYIKPEQPEVDFLRIGKPEDIKICDPACGSGHMLTYSFDLLYAIYEEEGYEPGEISEKILTHNLYGIEIDERAGELAAFALTMKARARQRRFFRKKVAPNICVLENVQFDEGELKNYMEFVGRDLFTMSLQTTLRQFEEADNFGSLIRPAVTDVAGMLKILESKKVSGQLFLSMTHQKVLQALQQAEYLSPKYHVVIANPPYMGGGGMNGRLGAWAKDNYPNSKSDLFAMFIERNIDLSKKQGVVAMITMQSWMFLSSFEALRARLVRQETLLSMAHLGTKAFDSIGGEVVSTTAFVLENTNKLDYKGGYLRLINGNSEADKEEAMLVAIQNNDCGWFYRASSADFKKIPSSPIAYWATDELRKSFSNFLPLGDLVAAKSGMSTTNNDKFLRIWHEISYVDFKLDSVGATDARSSGKKWFPYIKGGTFRRWYGNLDYVVNWKDDGSEIKDFVVNNPRDPNTTHWSRRIFNSDYFFQELLAWSRISMGALSVRRYPKGMIFSDASNGCFGDVSLLDKATLLLNSCAVNLIMEILSPTMNFYSGDIEKIPAAFPSNHTALKRLVGIATLDWNSYETSWDFNHLHLLCPEYRQPTLKATYQKLRRQWLDLTEEMHWLEEENNRIFIKAYGLQDELDEEVEFSGITLTCNPHYRFPAAKDKSDREAKLLAETIRELISYAVGCMFGRYALEKPGLILANQGETIKDYLKRVPEPSFPADDDNVIPMLDGDWFTDDISGRFRRFLRVTFGEEHYEENLTFIEEALNVKKMKSYTIRNYFLSEFYTDHWKRYKKRPIYWMFSSPKGSFNALIYLHRYRPDTVSVVLNGYLRKFEEKLISEKNTQEAVSISTTSSQREKTEALKKIEKFKKMIGELEEYESDVLYPLAIEKRGIDLDDGVKHNYPLFGTALKKIPGLSV